MHFSPKAIRFIIEALEYYQTSHEERLRDEGLTEDEVADLTHDCQYLEAIKTDLKKYHGELLLRRHAAGHGGGQPYHMRLDPPLHTAGHRR